MLTAGGGGGIMHLQNILPAFYRTAKLYSQLVWLLGLGDREPFFFFAFCALRRGGYGLSSIWAVMCLVLRTYFAMLFLDELVVVTEYDCRLPPEPPPEEKLRPPVPIGLFKLIPPP